MLRRATRHELLRDTKVLYSIGSLVTHPNGAAPPHQHPQWQMKVVYEKWPLGTYVKWATCVTSIIAVADTTQRVATIFARVFEIWIRTFVHRRGKKYFTFLEVKDKSQSPTTTIKFQIDLGATCNVLPHCYLKQPGDPPLESSTSIMNMYDATVSSLYALYTWYAARISSTSYSPFKWQMENNLQTSALYCVIQSAKNFRC